MPTPLKSSLKRNFGDYDNAQPAKKVKFAEPEPVATSELSNDIDDDNKDNSSGDAPAGGDLLSILNQLT